VESGAKGPPIRKTTIARFTAALYLALAALAASGAVCAFSWAQYAMAALFTFFTVSHLLMYYAKKRQSRTANPSTADDADGRG
jgi:fatty acid desaturase